MKHLLTLLLVTPLIFSLRFERIWDRETHWEESEFQTEYVGSVAAKYPIQSGLSFIGRAGYRFQDEQPQYALGLEYQFAYGR